MSLLIAALAYAWWQKTLFQSGADSYLLQKPPLQPVPAKTLSLAALDAAPADTKSTPPRNARMLNAISYGPAPEEVADICLPDEAYTNAPAIIFIHGGGWIKGRQSGLDIVCQSAASHGLVGVTIQYRRSSTNSWPSQLEDAQLAVRWLRAHAGDYKVDPQRVCSWGTSAGAHLAVFLGVMQTTRPGDRANLYANEPSTVSCVVDMFGPVDLTNPGKLQPRVSALIGSNSDPNTAQDASPLFFVNSRTAPTLIVQGDNDKLVNSAAQSEKLYSALKEHGVSTQMLTYHGGHNFKGLSDDEVAHYDDIALQFVITHLGQARSE
jgi:acetyl esterase/lipase